MASLFCFKCQHENKISGQVGRGDECPQCRADLHACKNCAHYDPNSYNECREPQADVVKEKERANFCDYFSPRIGAFGAAKKQGDLLSAAEALFKKK
jgi:hypothetical protein